MRLTIEKLGRIEHADIEIRPLTVFVGENHTNKTWAAYAAYAVAASNSVQFQWIGHSIPTPFIDELAWSIVFNVVDRSTSGVVRTTRRRDEFFRSVAPVTFELDSRLIRAAVRSPDIAPSTTVRATLGSAQVWDSIEFEIQHDQNRNGIVTAHMMKDGIPIHSEVGASGSLHQQLARVLETARRETMVRPVVIPTTRSTTPVATDVAHDIPGALFERAWQYALQSSDRRPSPFATAMGGEVTTRGRESVFRHAHGPEMAVTFAASLVGSLAPVDLLVRRVAEPGDLIVIDEPEMNAHPRAQLLIAESLARLANAGFKVLITTHSPYIVEHISNLMVAHRVPESRRDIVRRKSHGLCADASAFLDPENVAIYAFTEAPENPAVVRVNDVVERDTGLVNGSTFGPPSDDLANEYGILLEQLDDPVAK